MGRRHGLNRDRLERFIEAVKIGATFAGACAHASWCERSVYRYLKRGRDALEAAEVEDDPMDSLSTIPKADRMFAELSIRYDEALSASEVSHLANLIKDGKGDWKARAWVLERRWPERYSRTRKIGSDVAKVEAEVERTKVEIEMAKLQLEAMKRGGGTSRLLLPADLVQSMAQDEPELAEQLLGYLARKRRIGRGHGRGVAVNGSLSKGKRDEQDRASARIRGPLQRRGPGQHDPGG
jgi:hypothetical protein